MRFNLDFSKQMEPEIISHKCPAMIEREANGEIPNVYCL